MMSAVSRIVPISVTVSLNVEIVGEGKRLVLLPGWGCSTRAFHLLIPQLVARGFSVTGVNPRGIAGSTGPLDNLNLHDLTRDVAGVIEALKLAPAHVVGWAWGNRVARCLATDAPDLVDTIVLLAAGGLVPPEAEVATALSKLAGDQPLSPEDRRRHLQEALFASGSDPQLVELVDLGLWPPATQAQRAANHATPLEDWWAGGVKQMLVIQGLEDRAAPPTNGYALRDSFSERVQVVDLPHTGHAMVLEQPAAVAAAIDNWLHD